MGDTQTGSANMRDLVTSSIRLIAQFGVVPENDPGLAVVPVDYVCRAVVVTALSTAPLNQNLHLVDRKRLQLDDISEVLRDHGYSVKSLPRPEFNDQLKQVMSRSSRETQSVMSMLFDGTFEVDANHAEPAGGGRLESRRVVVESTRTLDGLEALGVPPPNVREALNSTIRFLNERRLLKAE
jgi:thioester reductase-like protein